MEKTFFIIKPDGMKHEGVFERVAALGSITKLKLTELSVEKLQEHYAHVVDKPFFPDIVEYMTSSPVVIGIIEGENIIAKLREELGATDPTKAEKGTIRRTYGVKLGNMMYNCVHASDSVENAVREIQIWFD